MNQAEEIGKRIRALRQEHQLSQRQLSRPGVSYAYISRVEAGARNPSMKALRLLAEGLGCTPHYLETGEELEPVAVDGDLFYVEPSVAEEIGRLRARVEDLRAKL